MAQNKSCRYSCTLICASTLDLLRVAGFFQLMKSVSLVAFPPVHASAPLFRVGETYVTRAGRPVTIVAEDRRPGYEVVQGDDQGEDRGWRYDRDSDRGRYTGATCEGPLDILPPT